MKSLATIMVALAALLLSGCNERRVERTRVVEREAPAPAEPSSVEPAQPAPPTASNPKVVEEDVDVDVDVDVDDRAFEQKRTAFMSAARERMNRLDAKIDHLQAEARIATGKAKVEAEKALAELQDEREQIRASFEQAKTRTRAEWDEFETDVDRGLNELERAYNDLLERMKTSG